VIATIYPLFSYAIRNDHYKLVVSQYNGYDTRTNACVDTTTDEFYEINEDEPPKLDTAPSDLLARKKPLTSEEREIYVALRKQVNALRNRQPFCVADINLDRVVNELDIDQWAMFEALSGGNSSWADINQDGQTNGVDEGLVRQHFGACPNKADSAGFGG